MFFSNIYIYISIWLQNDYYVEIVEGTPEVMEVISVTAVDHDQGKNGSVRYVLDPTTEVHYPGMFQLNPVSGQLTTRRSIDHEEFTKYDIVLQAIDQGTPPLTSSANIHIYVTDINDNVPLFYPLTYYAQVLETDRPQTAVVQVQATDADSGTFGTVRYAIAGGANQKFAIDSVSGWIRTVQTVDKSIKSSYRIEISAYDLGDMYSTHKAVVHVYVNNLLSVVPTFSEPLGYVFSITEDSGKGAPSIGRRVGQILSPGVGITYAIVGGNPQGLFVIAPGTGYITTTAAVDREQQAFYSLDIVASKNDVFSMTKANFTIGDINDNEPSFGQASMVIEVMENWPQGHDVLLAQANDPDSGENARLQYRLKAGSSPAFVIDADTGMITLAQSLSQVSDTHFTLIVTASDSGTPRYSAQLTVSVSVVDVNDHTPMFEQVSYEVSLEESRSINNLFYQVTANDEDSGDNAQVYYEITRGNVGNRFGIFPNGVLYVAHALDRESHDLYVLVIKVYDKGLERRSSLTNLTIHILDDNDNAPVFSNTTYHMSIDEGASIGNYVGTVYASDRDAGRNAELSFAFEGTHAGFEIHSKSGVIINTMSFDREQLMRQNKMDYIMLMVIVTDNGEPLRTDKATVRVAVVDSNDNAPEFLRKVYAPSVFENAEENTEIVRVSAEDEDLADNARITYSLLSGNEGDKFRVDSLNGQLLLKGTLDRETKDSYWLVVMATDSGYPPLNSTCEVHVTVLDYNDNWPIFLSMDTTFSVGEDAPIGEVIAHVSAVDADVGNKALVNYGIANNLRSPLFMIDANTGKLKLVATLDYESKSTYTVNVSATDNGTPALSSYLQLTINVEDYNDNAPRFSDTPIIRQIQEGVRPGITVVTVTANDPDSGANGLLRYSLANQEPGGRNFSIDPDTGDIKTLTEIDRETGDNFRLTVMATDQATSVATRKSAQKVVVITVQDVNDNSPRFITQVAAQVILGAKINTHITQIKAIDDDEGANGQVAYEISSGDRHIFTLEESSGNLYLRTELSPALLSYDLTISARDAGATPLTSYINLRVFVRSAIENGPQFSESTYYGEVYENEAAGTSVVTVTTVESGTNSHIEYVITSVKANGIDRPRYFFINPNSGIITTTEPLDRELGYDIFNIHVYAIDTSSTTPRTRSTMVSSRFTFAVFNHFHLL